VREPDSLSALQNGEIQLTTQPYTAWGGAVTARLYLPIDRSQAWQGLTDYPRWAEYFPAITHSEVVGQMAQSGKSGEQVTKRLYQAASKNFLIFTAQVDIHLLAIETPQQRIQFVLESGSFNDFTADLKLQDCGRGTLLSYSVQATPSIPVPAIFIEQAIQLDLPANLRTMRQCLCKLN
jgi:carbon monoxide dehydrogenase subunit G